MRMVRAAQAAWPHRLDRRRGGAARCRAWSRCGPMPTSRTCRRSISAPTNPPRRSSRIRQPALARGRVRYIGDPVAAVFAEDPYLAEDAAELVAVEIEELPVVLSASDPPGEFEPGRSGEAALLRHSYGDIEAAFRAAHTIIELDLSTGRHSGVPLETRGAHRPLRCGARHSGAARRRQNPASQPRDAVPHAGPQPVRAARA